MAHPNQHSELIEQRFIPRDLDDLTDLRTHLHDAGVAPSIAKGICGWLLELAAGEDLTNDYATRARYRKVLAEVARGDDPPRILVM